MNSSSRFFSGLRSWQILCDGGVFLHRRGFVCEKGRGVNCSFRIDVDDEVCIFVIFILLIILL